MNYKNTIKNETDVFKKDLSDVDGSYTKCIKENIETIYILGTDNSVDVNNFKKRVIEIVEPAHDTPAKRTFLMRLNSMTNKNKALMFVNNACMNGQGLGVI